jgi:predicted Rossmann fold flavoprotein
MSSKRVIVIGGGAAGFFGAITCAESAGDAEILILEKSSRFLDKVRISGGGRCNVTHALFDTREFATRYPRGQRELLSPFQRFQASDTVAWFEARGVRLKTEEDGRMFPITDSSQTVVDCLVESARAAHVKLVANRPVDRIARTGAGQFEVHAGGDILSCDRLLLATGGCRSPRAGELALSLGHTLEPPVPSLFTFHIGADWLRDLAGISVSAVEASVPGTGLCERGPLLVTHWGLSGPAILRLSAWGARALHELNYQCSLHVNWIPQLSADALMREFEMHRRTQPARMLVNTPFAPLPARLWEQLVLAAGLPRHTRWAELSRGSQHRLARQLVRTELRVSGKSLNKDEFVTCGGVRLSEVNLKTMESRLCAGVYFAGELLDIDGITGGFNFQAAWTTGWIAGQSIAKSL